MRFGLISAGLVGLFWILVGQVEEERIQQFPNKKRDRHNPDYIFTNLKEFILHNLKHEVNLY